MATYAVIAENDESQWHDQTGQRYHFPNRYKELIKPGTYVLYYKGKMRESKYSATRLSPEPHYFGIATIGTHERDKRSNKADWFATVEDYQPFSLAVPNKLSTGEYYEKIPASRVSNYWRDGVRAISQETYERIITAGNLSASRPTTADSTVLNDEIQELTSGTEGEKKLIFTTVYERDPALRKEAIRLHGTTCIACGFNFEAAYGEFGRDYIHIHHRKPISAAGGAVVVSPTSDLVPLCANCHSIVHRRKNLTLSVDELIAIIKRQKIKT